MEHIRDKTRHLSDAPDPAVYSASPPALSGAALLAGLMWLSWTVASFLFMFNLILPTVGNVFIVIVFLAVAIVASFSAAGGRIKNG